MLGHGRIFTFAVFVAGLPVVAGAQGPYFRGFDFRDGSTQANVLAMSRNGQFVLGSTGGPCVWRNGGPPTPLAVPPPYTPGTGWAVSSTGVVVGAVNANAGSETLAARWDAAGVMEIIAQSPHPNRTAVARAVSDDGSIAFGHWTGDADAVSDHLFVWRLGQGAQDLGNPYGGFNTVPIVCDAAGLTVVGRTNDVDFSDTVFRWTAPQGFQILPDGAFGVANALSADGLYIAGATSGPVRAARWQGISNPTSLGMLACSQPGGGQSYAQGISADGTTAVGTVQCSGTPNLIAFLWRESVGIRPLQDVLSEELGLELGGWQLREATAISDDGLTIAGRGLNGCGQEQAFIAYLGQPGASACAADFDHDGFVTGLDFDGFVAAFEAGVTGADFDLDCFVTGTDFDGFVMAFEQGC